jgi:CHASE2 domain-containing sensor protein
MVRLIREILFNHGHTKNITCRIITIYLFSIMIKKIKSFLSKHPNLSHNLSHTRLIYLLYLSLPFALIIPLRATGLIQPFEWLCLDTFLRLRPIEEPDNRVTIVQINDSDLTYLQGINELEVDSISDRALANAIEEISVNNPAAIGIDVIRDIPVGKGREQLKQIVHSHRNVIEIYKAYPPDPSSSALGLPPEQSGFVDGLNDADGRERRAIIAEPISYKYSLPYHLTRLYLASQNIQIVSASKDLVKFSNGKDFPSLIPVAGKYNRDDINNFQTLINYRHNAIPFQKISLKDILTKSYKSELIKNRVILIGYTATSRGDSINTNAILDPQQTKEPDQTEHQAKISNILYGVESHAHITSQLISYVLDRRVNLMPFNYIYDTTWLIFCIILGLLVPKIIAKVTSTKNTSTLFIVSLVTYLSSIIFLMFVLILLGIWVPIAATFLTFIISTPLLATIQEREHQLTLMADVRLQEREHQLTLMADVRLRVIWEAFNEIHNVPLQTIFNYQKDPNLSQETKTILTQICQEINRISDQMEKRYEEHKQSENEEEELSNPLNNILERELERQKELPRRGYLKNNLVFYIVSFDEISDYNLSADDKHKIRSFLEEAIRNIDKYAIDSTRVTIDSRVDGDYCYLEISDNGKTEADLNKKNNGTKNAEKLAKKLQGKFHREALKPYGYKCTLSWKCNWIES